MKEKRGLSMSTQKWRWTVYLVSIFSVIFIGFTVYQNRLRPSGTELSHAHLLTALVKAHQAAIGQEVFYEAKSGHININIYGITDPHKQDVVAEVVRDAVKADSLPEKVTLIYFGAREVVTTTGPNGSSYSTVIRQNSLRKVSFN